MSSEEHELPSQLKHQLEAPIKVSFSPSGQLEAIYSESSEPEFVTNIKKSLININLDWLQGSRMIDTNQIHRDDNTDHQQPRSYFKVMERQQCVDGRGRRYINDNTRFIVPYKLEQIILRQCFQLET